MTDRDPFEGLDDNLDADFGVPTAAAPKAPPATFQPRDFTEPCPACRGSGQFRSWTGRLVGECFKCKGAGKRTFKQSPEKRAHARVTSAARKDRVADEKKAAIDASARAWIEEHKTEAEWLAQTAKRNVERNGSFLFPQDLLTKLWQFGSLSENQLQAVRKLIARDEVRKVERVARVEAAPVVDVSKIEAAFATAVAKAARPGQLGTWVKPLRLTANNETFQVRPGSPGSQWEGMLFVRAGDRKLGHVANGKFVRKFSCTDAEEAAVLQACADPLQAALAYAKAFSCCAVCGKTLTNDGSMARGIGPICAQKFGW